MKKNVVSTRRTRVQAKRKRLGLNVDGKIQPFTWDGEVIKPNRKRCYCAALLVDRMIHTYGQIGDASHFRQEFIRRWVRLL